MSFNVRPAVARFLFSSVRSAIYLVVIIAGAAFDSAALAIDITQNASFATTNQSLFGPGPSSSYSNTWSWSLFSYGPAKPESWIPGPNNAGFNLPPITALYTGGSATVTASGSSSGEIKWVTDLNLDGGGINATIPYDITIGMPTYNEFTQDGFKVAVKNVAYNKIGAAMSSTSPMLRFETKLNFTGQAQFDVAASANFLGKNWDGSFNAKFPDNGNYNLNLDLISFNKIENGKPNGQVRIAGFLNLPDVVKKVLDQKKAEAKLVDDPSKLIDPATGKPSTTKPKEPEEKAKPTVAPKVFSTKYEPEPIFGSSFHYPFIALDTTKDAGAQVDGVLSSKGKSEFAALEINLVSLINKLIPQAPPLSAKFKAETSIGGGEVKLNALSVKLRPALNLTEKETIQPREDLLNVGFDFGTPMFARILNDNDPNNENDDTVAIDYTADKISSISGLKKGQKLQFKDALQGDSLLSLTPIYKANPSLLTEFGLSLGLSLPVDILQASAKLKFLGLEKDFKTNPYLFHADNPLAEVPLNPFYPITAPGSFTLDGFQDVRGGMLVLSTKAYEWTGAANTNMFYVPPSEHPGNYNTGGLAANDAPAGQNVIIPSNASADVVSNGTVGTLTVAGNSVVTVNPNETTPFITLTLNNDLKLDVSAQMLIKNNGTLLMSRAAGAAIDAGGGVVKLDGDSAILRTAGNLGLLSGTIGGRGKVDVTGDLIGGMQSQLMAKGGNLEVTALTVGGAGQDRLRLAADTNATLSLKSSVDSARVVKGGGKILLSQDSKVSNFVIDSGGAVETISNVLVTLGDGTLTNNGSFTATATSKLAAEISDLQLAGSGVLELRDASFSGPTDLLLTAAKLTNSATHTIRFTGSTASAINSDRPETWMAIENVGTIEAAMTAGTTVINTKNAAGSMVNQGVMRGLGDVPLTLGSGSFLNNGLFDAGNTTTTSTSGNIAMLAGANLENLSNAGSKYTLTGGIYRLNTTGSSISLNLKYASANPVDFVNKADIRLLGSGNGAANFKINGKALADMNSFENLPEGGVALGARGKFITTKLINRGALMLFGTDGVATTEIGNVSNEVGGTVLVVPGAAGSVAVMRMYGEGATATNRGKIVVDKASYDGSIKLTLTGDAPATNKFRNDGTVEVHGLGTELEFDGLSLSDNHAGANGADTSFKGGKWIVDAATMSLPLDAPKVLDADVKFIANSSQIQFNGATFENNINRVGTTGVLQLDGREMTFSSSLTNEGLITLTNDASVIVAVDAGGAPGLVNNGVIKGGGLVNQPAVVNDNLLASPPSQSSVPTPDSPAVINALVLNNSAITALNGQLTFQKDVTNLGLIRAQGPDLVNDTSGGGIGLEGAIIAGGVVGGGVVPGGTIEIDEGAALWGWGAVSATTLHNVGTIMANDFNLSPKAGIIAPRPLTIVVTPGVLNEGEMVATAGQTLNLVSIGGTLNNVGRAADPLTNTPAIPGYLRVQYVMADSGFPRVPFNGHMVINTTRVDRGTLEVRGAAYPMAAYDPDTGQELPITTQLLPLEKWASVDGPDATLDNVIIDVDQGILRSQVNQRRFTIIPLGGSEATILGSYVFADNGGIVLLTSAGNGLQKYSMFGSEIIARGTDGSGANPSLIELSNASIEGGTIKVEQGGQIEMLGNLRFSAVSNKAPLSVPGGLSLELANMFYGVDGSLDVENSGVLKLDGSVPIGGPIVSGSDLVGGNVRIKPGGSLQVVNTARMIGAVLTNNGTINLTAGQNLSVFTSPNSPSPSTFVANTGAISIASTILTIRNDSTVDGGVTWTEELGKLSQTDDGSSTTIKNGGQLDGNMSLAGGLLTGDGTITGALAQTGGLFEPGNSPGTFHVGSYNLSAGELNVEVASLSVYDKVVADTGGIQLFAGGLITIDLTNAEAGVFGLPRVGFDIFDVFNPFQIENTNVRFDVKNPQSYIYDSFDTLTGTVYLVSVPEPATLVMLIMAAAISIPLRHRRIS